MFVNQNLLKFSEEPCLVVKGEELTPRVFYTAVEVAGSNHGDEYKMGYKKSY